jgi:antitoxin MazE
MASIKVQLVKWGNSHAVRIPKTILDRAEIREGDKLEISVKDGNVALEPVSRKVTLQDLVSRITARNMHGEQSWGKPEGREVW